MAIIIPRSCKYVGTSPNINIERETGIITDNLELTADKDAPALLTALAKTKNPAKKNKPRIIPKRKVSFEYINLFFVSSRIKLIIEAVK